MEAMNMKRNMGTLDRVIRILVAVLFAILVFTGVISGAAAFILGILAAVFVITAAIGFCPLYLPFGISTGPKNGGDASSETETET